MSNSLPQNCANSECRETTIKMIHRSSRKVAIDAVDGPGVYAELLTYRCSRCGHTWGVRGYATQAIAWPANNPAVTMGPESPRTRGW